MSSDSDELFVGGVDIPAQLGGGVDIERGNDWNEDSDIELMVPDAHEPPAPRVPKRRRSRLAPLVTTGRFWTLVVHAGGGESEQVHAVAQFSWRIETQGGGDCGCIEYLADQVLFLATPADVPHDTSSSLFKVTAINACADRPLEIHSASSSSSVPTTVRAGVAAQGGSLQAVMRVSSTELESLRNAPSGAPCRFRTIPVHKRGVGAGAVESHPELKVLKRWRAQHKDDGGDIPMPAPSTPRAGLSHESVLPCLFFYLRK